MPLHGVELGFLVGMDVLRNKSSSPVLQRSGNGCAEIDLFNMVGTDVQRGLRCEVRMTGLYQVQLLVGTDVLRKQNLHCGVSPRRVGTDVLTTVGAVPWEWVC